MAKASGKIFDWGLYKKLMRYVRPYRVTYYFVLLAAILLSGFSTLTPYLLKVTVMTTSVLKIMTALYLYVGFMLGALLMEVLFHFYLCFLPIDGTTSD